MDNIAQILSPEAAGREAPSVLDDLIHLANHGETQEDRVGAFLCLAQMLRLAEIYMGAYRYFRDAHGQIADTPTRSLG